MEARNGKKINPSTKVLRYQQQFIYEMAQKRDLKESDFEENLLQTLNRIETKLDILLMQRNK
ncbi:hypothetical protein AC625_22200 [Peribacillus loiseleuriae]|uniref:Uncharacterized protein n=1 Tax=Peribacillus loiseleuriae TaxID=1679170 RepID=A0A0K9GYU9_9BACI|nr:hypothetical protein AC625_22200 [Peribacillus loiseleuriae]